MGSISVYEQMKDILDEYADRVDEVSIDCAASAARKTATKLKDSSARKTGEYAHGRLVPCKVAYMLIEVSSESRTHIHLCPILLHLQFCDLR